ncbi:MAG: pathogenicity locus, partial [Syntrophobacteraceae bacterium]|nr:pathogenicity locus [Syntrophobacteraceae bacterium]
MTGDEKKAILQNLKRIPGVGDSVAQDLFDLGYRS